MYILKKLKEYLINNKYNIAYPTEVWNTEFGEATPKELYVVKWPDLLQEIDRFSAEYQKAVD